MNVEFLVVEAFLITQQKAVALQNHGTELRVILWIDHGFGGDLKRRWILHVNRNQTDKIMYRIASVVSTPSWSRNICGNSDTTIHGHIVKEPAAIVTRAPHARPPQEMSID